MMNFFRKLFPLMMLVCLQAVYAEQASISSAPPPSSAPPLSTPSSPAPAAVTVVTPPPIMPAPVEAKTETTTATTTTTIAPLRLTPSQFQEWLRTIKAKRNKAIAARHAPKPKPPPPPPLTYEEGQKVMMDS